MIQEDKLLVLSQLISSMKEETIELEKAIKDKNRKKFDTAKENIEKINKEIKENITSLA